MQEMATSAVEAPSLKTVGVFGKVRAPGSDWHGTQSGRKEAA